METFWKRLFLIFVVAALAMVGSFYAINSMAAMIPGIGMFLMGLPWSIVAGYFLQPTYGSEWLVDVYFVLPVVFNAFLIWRKAYEGDSQGDFEPSPPLDSDSSPPSDSEPAPLTTLLKEAKRRIWIATIVPAALFMAYWYWRTFGESHYRNEQATALAAEVVLINCWVFFMRNPRFRYSMIAPVFIAISQEGLLSFWPLSNAMAIIIDFINQHVGFKWRFLIFPGFITITFLASIYLYKRRYVKPATKERE